jgi:flagellar protein FliS
MTYSNPLSTYRETRVKTASQGQLVVMLYDEAVKQLDRGITMMKSGKENPSQIEQGSKSIQKTQAIITELMVSLNFDQGGDIAKNLFSIYTWFNQELMASNMNQDVSRIVPVRNMMDNLRQAWTEIAARTSTVGMTSNLGVDIAS